MLLRSMLFDDLRSKLLSYEQPIKYKKDRSQFIHQAFLATTSDAHNQGGGYGN